MVSVSNSITQMQTVNRILTPEQCAKIITNLDECISFFEHKPGILTGDELRAKSLLKVLRNEIADKSRPAELAKGQPYQI